MPEENEKKPRKKLSLKNVTPGEFFLNIKSRLFDRLPRKTYINLVAVTNPRINWVLAVPLMVLVVVAVACFAKLAVWDRVNMQQREARELSEVRSALEAEYRYLENYDAVAEEYAHYTYSGMTTAERERADRLDVMELLRRIVLPRTTLDNWSVSENTVTLSIRALSLEDVNMLVQLLLSEPMVDYCDISTANSDRDTVSTEENDSKEVSAVLTVMVKRYEPGMEDAE